MFSRSAVRLYVLIRRRTKNSRSIEDTTKRTVLRAPRDEERAAQLERRIDDGGNSNVDDDGSCMR